MYFTFTFFLLSINLNFLFYKVSLSLSSNIFFKVVFVPGIKTTGKVHTCYNGRGNTEGIVKDRLENQTFELSWGMAVPAPYCPMIPGKVSILKLKLIF